MPTLGGLVGGPGTAFKYVVRSFHVRDWCWPKLGDSRQQWPMGGWAAACSKGMPEHVALSRLIRVCLRLPYLSTGDMFSRRNGACRQVGFGLVSVVQCSLSLPLLLQQPVDP